MANEYVEWFVNREKQRQGFILMLEGKTAKQIMVIKAGPEMGKTWLIQRLYHDCRGRGTPVAVLDFSQRQPWDYLTIVRQARDQFGSPHFNYLTNVINASTGVHVELSTEKVEVNVPIQNSELINSPVNVSEVRLTADKFDIVKTDSDMVRRNLEIRITDAFIACVQALAQGQRVVFLLDTMELAPPPATDWLVNNLLWRVRRGDLPGVLLIMAGREVPELDRTWDGWVGKSGLDPFDDKHIEEFILKRGLQGRSNVTVAALLMFSRGSPGMLGKMADNALAEDLAKDPEPWM